MDYEQIASFLDERADHLSEDERALSTAYRLYAYEVRSSFMHKSMDIEDIRSMVEATSPVLEELYRFWNEEGSIALIGGLFAEGSGRGSLYVTASFAAIMCLASRIYEDLDPVFARDIMHSALEAGHYLMVGQFRSEDTHEEGALDEPSSDEKRISIEDMRSRDHELSESEVYAQLWAYSELLATDTEVRNAYDHSMMAGMPQKMTRQKRYRIRFKDLLAIAMTKVQISHQDSADMISFPAFLSALLTDERSASANKSPQLIKVIEYSAPGTEEVILSEAERTFLERKI